MFEDYEFDFGDVVGVNPVFGGVADKVLLFTACGRVADDGVSAGAHKVILFGEFDDEGVVVFAEEGLSVETGCENGLEDKASFLVVLFLIEVRVIEGLGGYEDLLEGGVVEAGVVRQVVHISNNVGDLSELVNVK
jgi:hypothetical protein